MAFIIGDNRFTVDSSGVRGTRLSMVSSYIDSWSAELELEAALLDWGRGANAAYEDALINHTDELGEKSVAIGDSLEAYEEMYDRYIQLSVLLKSRYGNDKLTLKEYGIAGNTPKKQLERYYKAVELIKKNDERLAAGDPKALPAGMVAGLVTLADNAETAYQAALEKRRDAKKSTADFKALYDADSVQLRILYNWCISYWGKHNPKLIDLGFVKSKSHHRGQPGEPQNLSYDNITSVFNWDSVARTTSYQCEIQDASKPDADWNEIYEGVDTAFIWLSVKGKWNVKVRARNKHGFGNWGEEIVVVVNY